MIQRILLFTFLFISSIGNAQLSPAITSWLQNNTVYGSFYKASTGSTPQAMTVLANCQEISYSNHF